MRMEIEIGRQYEMMLNLYREGLITKEQALSHMQFEGRDEVLSEMRQAQNERMMMLA